MQIGDRVQLDGKHEVIEDIGTVVCNGRSYGKYADIDGQLYPLESLIPVEKPKGYCNIPPTASCQGIPGSPYCIGCLFWRDPPDRGLLQRLQWAYVGTEHIFCPKCNKAIYEGHQCEVQAPEELYICDHAEECPYKGCRRASKHACPPMDTALPCQITPSAKCIPVEEVLVICPGTKWCDRECRFGRPAHSRPHKHTAECDGESTCPGKCQGVANG